MLDRVQVAQIQIGTELVARTAQAMRGSSGRRLSASEASPRHPRQAGVILRLLK
jgi:hypothetical protein